MLLVGYGRAGGGSGSARGKGGARRRLGGLYDAENLKAIALELGATLLGNCLDIYDSLR